MKKEELLYIDQTKRYALLLGYIIPLTKSELDILTAIRNNSGYTRVEDIMQIVFTAKDITTKNVAVHVCRINYKARKISGRDIIESKRFKGYKIVDKI